MNDQIPADKVREIIDAHRDGASRRAGVILAALEALLPTPPTLADMTDEQRAACRWMQADVADHDTRYVIANPHDRHGEVTLVAADGKIEWILPEYATPRPDLPRLEWPGDKKPAPALPDGWRLADHREYGRGIVTNPTPDDDGDVYFAFPFDDLTGYDWDACRPDELTYIDTEPEEV